MKKLLCSSIRPLLPAFATRELDAALTTLVHEHLRNCPACAAEAAEILRTINALRTADPGKTQPAPALAPHRRKRTLWLMGHPLVGWFFLHRHITGILCAVIVMTAVFFLLLSIKYPDIFKLKRIPVEIYKPVKLENLPVLEPTPVPLEISPEGFAMPVDGMDGMDGMDEMDGVDGVD